MEDGLIERLRLLANIVSLKGETVDVEGVKITFKPNLPINRSDIIKQISDSQEFIPLLVSLGWLDDIDDPEEILEMLRAQKEEEIKLNQKAMGTANSHSDVEMEEEDDADDQSENQERFDA